MSGDMKIKVGLNIEGVSKAIKELEQKLKATERVSTSLKSAVQSHGAGSKMGQYAQGALNSNNQRHKGSLQSDIRQEQQTQATKSRAIKENVTALEKMLKTKEKIKDNDTDGLKILDQMILKKEKLLKMDNTELTSSVAKAGVMKKKLDEMGDGDGGGKGGDKKPIPGKGGGFGQLLKGIGVAAIVKGALNAVITGAEHMVTRDRKMLGDQAGAANIAGREQRELMAGQGGRGAFFSTERAKAMKTATDEMKGRQGIDTLKLVGGALLAVGGAAAIVGSGGLAAPLVAAAAGSAGIAGGGALALGSERGRTRAFDPEKYNKMMTKEGMDNYSANFAAEKAINYKKGIARDTYEQDLPDLINLQDQIGMSDADMFGGKDPRKTSSLESAIQKSTAGGVGKPLGKWVKKGRGAGWDGFGEQGVPEGTGPMPQSGKDPLMDELLSKPKPFSMLETVEETSARNKRQDGGLTGRLKRENITMDEYKQQARGIIAAGGTSEGAREGGIAAGRLSRSFGDIGAASTIGKLSGAGMGADQTEDAVLKILAGAVQTGVDKSELAKMPADLKRFTAVAAEMATKSGVFSQGSLDLFEAGTLDTTKSGIAGAKAAADEFGKNASDTGGLRGQIGMGIINKEFGDKLSNKQRVRINAVDPTEMGEGDWQALADDLNLKVEDVKDKVGKVSSGKQNFSENSDKQRDAISEKLKGMDPKKRAEFQKRYKAKTGFNEEEEPEMRELQKMISDYSASGLSTGSKTGGIQQRDNMAFLQSNEVSGFTKGVGEGVEIDPNTGKELRAAKQQEGVAGDDAKFSNLKEYSDILITSAKGLSKGVIEYETQFSLLLDAAKKNTGDMEAVNDAFSKIRENLETQATSIANDTKIRAAGGDTPKD